MLSSEEIETLIASKKREIEREKVLLGLAPLNSAHIPEDAKENETGCQGKRVNFKEDQGKELQDLGDCNEPSGNDKAEHYELEERIPAGLERYIRRYIGLPVMLKAGEYSPNNPLVRGERIGGGDALLGLGEYERRRNTLRKIRQAQYREYLDRQAQKKQEEKAETERQRREQEERERQREERERQLLSERDTYSPERRRASVSCVPNHNVHKVDSAVQVDGVSKPLSVAVQTDDAELYTLSPSPSKLTQAERELSPRTVSDGSTREAAWNKWECERRRSYGDFDERTTTIKRSNRDKLHSDLRHSYMPSIFDADAIQLRNLQAEKEAAERRQFYQQELKNQIMEQQRIREERKSREKLLEQAEMRRLEEQLRMLRVAQEREIDRQHDITAAMKDNAKEFETKRTELQRDIEIETQKLRASSHPTRNLPKRTETSHSDSQKLPFSYPKSFQPIEKKPYSFNIPDNSIFNPNYDVDTYLRKNLNFKKNKHGVDMFNNNDRIDKELKRDERNDRNAKMNENDRSETINLNRNEKNGYANELFIMNEIIETDPNQLMNKNNDATQHYKMSDRFNQQNKQFKMNQKNDRENQSKINEIDSEIKQYKLNERTDLESKQFNLRNDRESNQFNTNKRIETDTKQHRTNERIDVEIHKINDKVEKPETRKFIVEKALIHSPKQRNTQDLSIPILRHPPKTNIDTIEATSHLSEAMKKVDDKWKVPAVQKNILKSLPNEDGKNISILTQLGSIRRQLQLEQLKLDKMLSKNDF